VRPKSKPIAAAAVVSKLLSKDAATKDHALQARALEVFAAFQRIGPPITDYAEPALLRRGILTLNVCESTWMTELALLQKQIVDRLNRMLGKPRVREIRLRLGNVKKKEIEKPKIRPLTPKQQDDVAEWAQSIADPSVRQAMVQAATKSLGRGPIDAPIASGPPGPRAAIVEAPPEPEPPRYGYGFARRDRWKLKKEDE
jgi:hypothetical protein